GLRCNCITKTGKYGIMQGDNCTFIANGDNPLNSGGQRFFFFSFNRRFDLFNYCRKVDMKGRSFCNFTINRSTP
ncbi:MAG: hypothetical protein KAQ71_15660, partial [Desulfobulbaceae bacterium]|nr:hypothetical protein [Desulfobulbaceae bacterium]